jgi:hypothetical protein
MAEPDNLILSILREMRAEMSAFRGDVDRRFDVVDRRFDAVDERLDSVETKTDGIAVLLASVVGHFSHEVQELRVRLDRIDSTQC